MRNLVPIQIREFIPRIKNIFKYILKKNSAILNTYK